MVKWQKWEIFGIRLSSVWLNSTGTPPTLPGKNKRWDWA
jgi:hypothetical protein